MYIVTAVYIRRVEKLTFSRGRHCSPDDDVRFMCVQYIQMQFLYQMTKRLEKSFSPPAADPAIFSRTLNVSTRVNMISRPI